MSVERSEGKRPVSADSCCLYIRPDRGNVTTGGSVATEIPLEKKGACGDDIFVSLHIVAHVLE